MKRTGVLFFVVVVVLIIWSNFSHKKVDKIYEIYGERIHIVQKGECINRIASKYSILPRQLREANGMDKKQFLIYPKQRLVIPVVEWKSYEGRASWYGPGFHGKKMANGEVYDQNKISVAHRLFPLGLKVRITNLINGKSIEALVLDRGPYTKKYGKYDREIDLSYGAAKVLDSIQKGVVPVRITPLLN